MDRSTERSDTGAEQAHLIERCPVTPGLRESRGAMNQETLSGGVIDSGKRLLRPAGCGGRVSLSNNQLTDVAEWEEGALYQ